MRWTLKLAVTGGTEVSAHATLVVLLAWLPLASLAAGRSLAALGAGLSSAFAVMLAIAARELARAGAAAYLGLRIRSLTLHPTGGIARFERLPEGARLPVLAALAGPVANATLGAVVVAWLFATGAPMTPILRAVDPRSFLADLAWASFVLAAINALPGLPLDGGRVLRAALASQRGEANATRIAAGVGEGIALALALGSLVVGEPAPAALALCLWIGATDEAISLELDSAVGAIPVSRAMATDFRAVSPEDSLDAAVELVAAGWRQVFPVVDGGKLVGVLPIDSLLVSLVRLGRQAPVGDAMERSPRAVEASEMLEGAMTRLRASRCGLLPVVRGARLVGVLTEECVGRYVVREAARREDRPESPRRAAAPLAVS